MGIVRILTILFALFMNFVGAIYLETRMTNNFTLELVLIVIGILVSIIMLLGLAFESKWSWPLATIIFSASLANSVFLYFSVNTFLVFGGLLFFNLLGLVISVVSIPEKDDFDSETSDSFPVDSYDEEPKSVVYKSTTKKKKK